MATERSDVPELHQSRPHHGDRNEPNDVCPGQTIFVYWSGKTREGVERPVGGGLLPHSQLLC